MASADSSPAGGAALAAPLGLHEELSHPGAAAAAGEALRCVCGPDHLWLRSEHGEIVRPRGRSVNRCAYCARLAAVENCEMLALDAMEGDAPVVLLVLGTRTATVEMEGFYDGLRLVKRALRRRWPDCEYASLVEFTTGYGEKSGGLRRPHWNLLLKGVPADAADQARDVAARVWCRHVDAEEHAQHGAPIYSAGGLMKYLALHFQKATQEPPAGFTGQRFNCSRGYFTGCTRAVARSRAREALAVKRELWRAEAHAERDGHDVDAHDVELDAQLAYRERVKVRWELATATGVRVSREVWKGDTRRRLWQSMDARLQAEAVAMDRHRDELLDPSWLAWIETLWVPCAVDPDAAAFC